MVLLSSCDSMKSMTKGFEPLSLLTQNTWVLESIMGSAVSKSDFGKQLPFLNFNSDGKMNGSTGCNNFNGDFQLKADQLSLNPGAMTKMACAGNGEKDFLNSLGQVAGLSNDDGKLQLLDSAGKTLLSFLPKL